MQLNPAISGVKQRIEMELRQSWRRCRNELSLRPKDKRGPSYVAWQELNRRRRLMGSTFQLATTEMDALNRQMQGSVGISLIDTDGVIVYFASGPRMADCARRAGMREGAIWSEAAQGTNGMGTCLVARVPVLVELDEHYLQQNAGFTCCAAPIHDSRGVVVGVINVSCVGRLNGLPMMALVENAVRAVESRVLLASSGDAHILRFHSLQAHVVTAGEGLLLIDSSGQVLGTNQSGVELLGCNRHDDILGRSIEDLVGVTLHDLQMLARRRPWEAQPLADTDRYGLLQSPVFQTERRLDSHGSVAAGRPLAQAEQDALLRVLEACEWNVALAARQLGLGRKTLYRKMERYKLMRPRAASIAERDY